MAFSWVSTIPASLLLFRDIKIPESGKIYSFNEGNMDLWDSGIQDYIKSLKCPEKWAGKPYSARYIGSLVGDFHRTLLYGGIYGYPADRKNKNGKLRLLYECAPMSFLAEQAGGLGTTGSARVRHCRGMSGMKGRKEWRPGLQCIHPGEALGMNDMMSWKGGLRRPGYHTGANRMRH